MQERCEKLQIQRDELVKVRLIKESIFKTIHYYQIILILIIVHYMNLTFKSIIAMYHNANHHN